MKKTLILIALSLTLLISGYYIFVYYVPYSTGVRTGELIKISRKGVLVKTWEGEISQGVSGAQIFSFSVTDDVAIERLNEYQGSYVRLSYIERYRTFFWLGETKYFVTEVKKETSPH